MYLLASLIVLLTILLLLHLILSDFIKTLRTTTDFHSNVLLNGLLPLLVILCDELILIEPSSIRLCYPFRGLLVLSFRLFLKIIDCSLLLNFIESLFQSFFLFFLKGYFFL